MAQTFERYEHADEIRRSRVGGLGGSDADILYRLAVGLDLTKAQWQRLSVAVGAAAPSDMPPTASMAAGHDFEDWCATRIPLNTWQREQVLQGRRIEAGGNVLQMFAHADFYCDGYVCECKFSQRSEIQLFRTYMPQLQWYYWLGAQSVTMLVGRGSVQPFEVTDVECHPIERSEAWTDTFDRGLEALAALLDEKQL